MNKFLIILFLISCASKPKPVVEIFYVTTAGTAGNAGTLGSPWSLRKALSHPAGVDPGDQIYVLAGTYTDTLTSFLTGTLTNPIVVRAVGRVIIDGTLQGDATSRIPAITIRGAYTWFWGFEVTNSSTDRTGSFAGPDGRGDAFEQFGVGTRIINCILYDCGQGIASWIQAEGAENYGNIIFNNGWLDTDNSNAPTGHGIYTQNEAPTKYYKDNIVGYNFDFGFHAYTQGGALKNFHLEGNVSYSKWLMGGGEPLQDLKMISNYSYRNQLQLGYIDDGNDTLELTNNYFANGFDLLYFKNVTATGNTIFSYKTQGQPFGSPFFIRYKSATTGPPNLNAAPLNFAFNNNRYYRNAANAQNDFFFWWTNVQLSEEDAMLLPAWQAEGQDGTVTFETFAAPVDSLVLSGKRTFTRVNAYDSRRAHVIVYNWGKTDSVKVGVNGVLTQGQTYELRNSANYFGDVITGTFAGGDSLTFSMKYTDHSVVALPVGHGTAMGPNTFPEFGAFVLINTSATLPDIITVPNRGQSGVIKIKTDRDLPNSIKLK